MLVYTRVTKLSQQLLFYIYNFLKIYFKSFKKVKYKFQQLVFFQSNSPLNRISVAFHRFYLEAVTNFFYDYDSICSDKLSLSHFVSTGSLAQAKINNISKTFEHSSPEARTIR